MSLETFSTGCPLCWAMISSIRRLSAIASWAQISMSLACPSKPPQSWWMSIFAFGSAIRLPFAPAANTSFLRLARPFLPFPTFGRRGRPAAERARDRLGLLRRRPPRPARDRAGACVAPGGLLVDRQHDRTVDDQALVRPLLEQVGEEALDEPLAASDDGSAQPDPDEALVEVVDLFDQRSPREGRRP